MPLRGSENVTVDDLRSSTLADLLVVRDDEGEREVEEFLESALETANDFVAGHGKHLDTLPGVRYDPWESGIRYDPYHHDGEMLIVGGPRGLLQGGYQVLSTRGHMSRESLLGLLCKGLLTSYNQELVEAHFGANDSRNAPNVRDSRGSTAIELYGRFDMLKPAVDEAFTQPFVLYVEGDITDADLRADFVDEWAAWFEEMSGLDVGDVPLFRAVASAVCERVDDVDGTPREKIIHALAIQEPLVRDGDVSVLGDWAETLI